MSDQKTISTPQRVVEPLLSPGDKARELSTTTETLRRWRRDGFGPKFVQYGEMVRYFPEQSGAS